MRISTESILFLPYFSRISLDIYLGFCYYETINQV